MDSSWERVSRWSGPLVACVGRVADRFLKWASGGIGGPNRPSPLPAFVVVLLLVYLLDIGGALFITSYDRFVSWEEGFVIVALLAAMVLSTHLLRGYIAEEYNAAKVNGRRDLQEMNRMAGWAQSRPFVGMFVALSLARCAIRIVAFCIPGQLLLPIETALESIFVAVVGGISTYHIIFADIPASV
jgi:hypothetical protein